MEGVCTREDAGAEHSTESVADADMIDIVTDSKIQP